MGSSAGWARCPPTPPATAVPTDTLDECLTLVTEGVDRARSADDSYWLSHYLFLRAQLEWMSGHRDAAALRRRSTRRVARQPAPADHRQIAGTRGGVSDDAGRLARRPGGDAQGPGQPPGNRRPGRRSRCDDRDGRDHGRTREHAGRAGFLREAITEARRIGYGNGEIYGAWAVASLACRHGLHRDAATMDDALAEHIALVERGLPRGIFLDYLGPSQTPAAPPVSRPHADSRAEVGAGYAHERWRSPPRSHPGQRARYLRSHFATHGPRIAMI